MTKTIITIARQYGSGGRLIGKKLSEILEVPFYDKELIAIAAKQSGMSEEVFAKADERASSSLLYSLVMGSYTSVANNMPINDKLFLLQSDIIKEAAKKGPFVIVGRCADYILREHPRCANIFISASHEARVARLCAMHHISEEEAENMMSKADKKRSEYYNYYSYKTWGAAATYHLCIDSSVLGIEKTIDFVEEFVKLKIKMDFS